MTRVHAMLSDLGRQHAPAELQNDIKDVLQGHAQYKAYAVHFHSVFDENTLANAQETDASDLKTFEEELAALTLPDDAFTTGGTVLEPA